jgi:hypothetical protein
VRALVVALAMLAAGCAQIPGFEPSVDSIIGEAVSAARAPAAEQKAALGRAQAAFVREASPANRLRLATLLAALPAPLRDDARAIELLEPIADGAAAGTGRFAALLSAQIVERQRLARELERTAREAERTARERDKADKERDKREEALRQQLEALRAIERGILEREEKLRKKPK